MQNLHDFGLTILDVVASPWGRLITTVLSVCSFALSLWALKTNRFFRKSFRAEHERFIEGLWQDVAKFTLSNDDFATRSAKIFRGLSAEEMKQDAALLAYVNILSYSFNAKDVISADFYESNMRSFFTDFSLDKAEFDDRLNNLGYDGPFRSECKRFMEKYSNKPIRKPTQKIAVQTS